MRYAALLLLASSPAAAQLSERALATAVARPPVGAHLPGGLVFRDAAGRRATLAAVAGGRPLALIFADYTCRHVCAPGVMLTAAALRDGGLVAGRDYRLAVIGMDPRDTAADARRFGAALSVAPALARATTLLTGDAATLAAATGALGYRSVRDPANDQFAHDAVVYAFGRDGRLTALLPELGLRPDTLRAALTGDPPALEGLAAGVAHLCYGFAAAQGRFARPIVLALQASALALLAGAAWWLLRRRGTPA